MDTPVVPPEVIASMPTWVQVLLVVLTAVGALLPLFSGFAKALNVYEAKALERGEKLSTGFLAFVAGVNAVALNSSRAPKPVVEEDQS
ncbi:MAG: hypothetical protein Q8L48_16685 [Archangium sp.]|nr:hypothetical protein [Archangium sp.]